MKHGILLSFCLLAVTGLLEAKGGKAELDIPSITVVNKTKKLVHVMGMPKSKLVARVKSGDTMQINIDSDKVHFVDLATSNNSAIYDVTDGATYVLYPERYTIGVMVK